MWEAQFGDFANTAQCVINSYVTLTLALALTPTLALALALSRLERLLSEEATLCRLIKAGEESVV